MAIAQPDDFLPCPNALTGNVPSQMQIGLRGVFMHDRPLNLRENPARTAPPTGVIAPDERFAVIGGPACDATFTWWQIQTETAQGWLGEVDPSDLSYWLVPLDETMTPAPSALVTIDGLQLLSQTTLESPAGLTTLAGGGIAVRQGNRVEIVERAFQDSPQTTIRTEDLLAWTITPDAGQIFTLENSDNPELILWRGDEWTPQLLDVSVMAGTRLLWLPDIELLALSDSQQIRLFDPPSESIVAVFRLDAPSVALAAHAPNNWLAVLLQTGDLVLLDVTARNERLRFRNVFEGVGRPNGLAFSPDGAILAASTGVGVHLWDTESGSLLARLDVFESISIGEVTSLSFHLAGDWLAVGALLGSDNSGQIWVWDVENGQLLAELVLGSPLLQMAFDEDGRRLHSLTQGGGWQIWSLGR